MVTVWLDSEYDEEQLKEVLDFDYEAAAGAVAEEVLAEAGCPFPAEVSLTLTDEEGIHEVNRETRGIDRPTDVLSFPVFQYDTPGDFREAEEDRAGSFDPETGNLLLGDILISVDAVRAQAEEYGHSRKREFSFLVAHSMLHLIGYDHMTEPEEKEMFRLQEQALNQLGITRGEES